MKEKTFYISDDEKCKSGFKDITIGYEEVLSKKDEIKNRIIDVFGKDVYTDCQLYLRQFNYYNNGEPFFEIELSAESFYDLDEFLCGEESEKVSLLIKELYSEFEIKFNVPLSYYSK